MKPDDPNVGQALESMARQSLREMNAARRYAESERKGGRQTMEKTCPPHLKTSKEIAELLNVSPITIKVWALKGKIPSVIVRSQRFYEADKVVVAFRKMSFQRR